MIEEIKLPTNDPRFINLVGTVFSRLLVVKFKGWSINGKRRKPTWECKCTCGANTVVSGSNLQSGQYKILWLL